MDEKIKINIEKWMVLNEVETNEGIEVIYPNGESKVFFNEDKDELYYLVDRDFVKGYIDYKLDRMFIDRIYLNLGQGNMVLEII